MSRHCGLRSVVGWVALVIAGCSGGAGGPKGDASDSIVDGGGNDLAVVGDSALPSDAASPGGDATPVAQAVPVGDHFCLHQAPSDAIGFYRGWDTECVVSTAVTPPFTAALKTSADYGCKFFDDLATTPPSCPPREDVIGFCDLYPNLSPALKGWTLIYKSKVLPDTDALSLNLAAAGCVLQAKDPSGQPIPLRKCTGTVTAKVDGVLKDFSSKLYCTYKSDGSKAAYFVEADTTTTDRLQLFILKEAGVISFVTEDPLTAVSKGAGYLEGGNNAFVIPVSAATRTVAATTFADRGAGLISTFSMGDYKNGSSQIRTITEGSINIKIEP